MGLAAQELAAAAHGLQLAALAKREMRQFFSVRRVGYPS
jgi:hypothetical protein